MGTNIVAAGMVTALGLDWQTSCAAARAGISRASPLQHYRVQGENADDVQFVSGHQAELLTQGFEGRTRLLRLLAGALKDLARNASGELNSVGWVYLALPDPARTFGNMELIEDEEMREQARSRLVDAPWANDPGDAEDLLLESAGMARWPGRLRLAAVSRSGPAGMLDVLQKCMTDIASGHVENAIVGGVDSLLDDETLGWLECTGRLKNPRLAAGLTPGEAAVLFLVGRRETQTALGTIESVAIGTEDRPFQSGQASLGRGLSGAVSRLAKQERWPGQDHPWVVSDHNGEAYAGGEWGWALQRLAAAKILMQEAVLWLPAVWFGDTGTARVPAAVTCALAAWNRGYAPANRCVIIASQDDGRRAALLLDAPGGGHHV
jgi:3-oxoacyl-[acyl-carrier-protein] synthase I